MRDSDVLQLPLVGGKVVQLRLGRIDVHPLSIAPAVQGRPSTAQATEHRLDVRWFHGHASVRPAEEWFETATFDTAERPEIREIQKGRRDVDESHDGCHHLAGFDAGPGDDERHLDR